MQYLSTSVFNSMSLSDLRLVLGYVDLRAKHCFLRNIYRCSDSVDHLNGRILCPLRN